MGIYPHSVEMLRIRAPHQTQSRFEEMNNIEAVTVNINSPNWNIPYGNEPNRGKTIFQLTNPKTIKATPKTIKATANSKRSRKNRKTGRTRRA